MFGNRRKGYIILQICSRKVWRAIASHTFCIVCVCVTSRANVIRGIHKDLHDEYGCQGTPHTRLAKRILQISMMQALIRGGASLQQDEDALSSFESPIMFELEHSIVLIALVMVFEVMGRWSVFTCRVQRQACMFISVGEQTDSFAMQMQNCHCEHEFPPCLRQGTDGSIIGCVAAGQPDDATRTTKTKLSDES